MLSYLKSFAKLIMTAALFVACSDSDSGTKVVEKEVLQVAMYFDELPECSKENEGVQIYVREERTKRICAGGFWRALGGSSVDSVRKSVKCYTQVLKDSSGVKIVCGKDSVGVVLNGLQGEKGLQGEQGDAGKNGAKGATGATGDKGDKGPTGYTGADGADGRNGSDGSKGETRYCYMESDYDYYYNYSSSISVYCDYEYAGEKVYVGSVKNGSDGKNGTSGSVCTFSTVYGSYSVYEMGVRGVAVYCNGDSVGIILNGKRNSFCYTVALDDGSGNKVICDGDSVGVGVVLNGKNGDAGMDGIDGLFCYTIALNDGSGNKIVCDGDSVGVLLNGKDGTTCFMSSLDDESGFKIVCDGDSIGAVRNGSDGTNGTDGKSCTMNTLSNGNGYEILCDGESVGIVKNGTDGTSCTKELMDNKIGYNLKCGDEKVGEWYDELGLCYESRKSTIAIQNGTYYYCTGSEWIIADEFERNTYGLPCNDNGEVLTSLAGDSKKYVCESGTFREANELEKSLGFGCFAETKNMLVDSAYSRFAYGVYQCVLSGTSNYSWQVYTYDYYPDVEYETMTDKRDGKVYKIVTIGEQTWMAENLNYTDATIDVEERSSCYEGFDKNCDKYGRLYSWASAMDSAGLFSESGKGCGNQKECSPTYPVRGICPEDWHLPTNDEWDSLYATMGRNVYAMHARNDKGWKNATNLFGFSALPAGMFNGYNFEYLGSEAFFWSASYYDGYWENAYYWHMYSNEVYITDFSRQYHASVRCVKD